MLFFNLENPCICSLSNHFFQELYHIKENINNYPFVHTIDTLLSVDKMFKENLIFNIILLKIFLIVVEIFLIHLYIFIKKA